MPPTGIIGADDFQQILSDALTSFSPLATLVGADSAREFAHEVTNKKQIVLATLAPIGALGMMATVCKSSDLPGIKDLLGAGDEDIYDAGSDIGCYVLFGLVGKLSKRGGLTCKDREGNAGIAACAIVNYEWKLGERALDFEQFRSFLYEFSAATISGRAEWRVGSMEDLDARAGDVREAILSCMGRYADVDEHMRMFEALENFSDGHGYVELHWPSPAMPLETRPCIIYLSVCALLAIFFFFAIFTTAFLQWQTVQAAALLLGGQIVLSCGQTLTHVIIKRIRSTKALALPAKGLIPNWSIVDNTWFTSHVARRSLNPSLSGGFVHLSQHVRFSQPFVPRWQALFTLLLLIVGFVAFYVGAKSSYVWTVLIFIILYVFANASKGYVVHLGNVCYYTPLNNFGYNAVVKEPGDASHKRREATPRKDTAAANVNGATPQLAAEDKGGSMRTDSSDGMVGTVDGLELLERGFPELAKLTLSSRFERTYSSRQIARTMSKHSSSSIRHESTYLGSTLGADDGGQETRPNPGAGAETSSHASSSQIDVLKSTASSTSDLTIEYRLFAKIAVRNVQAIGMFYFSRSQEWSMAAHAINSAVQRYLGDDWRPPVTRESICEIPVEFACWERGAPSTYVCARLLLLIDVTRYEDLFWATGQEICSMVMDCFSDGTRLLSENPQATEIRVMQELRHSF